jgi:RNA polymerase sigma-70 factor (ECF subfamily)
MQMNRYAVVMNRSMGCCSLSLRNAAFPAVEEPAWRQCADRLLARLAPFVDTLSLQTHECLDPDGTDSPADAHSDEALIRACLSRDPDSFAGLVERYEAAVTGILWHFTRDRLVLEELVQDTFVEAYFSLRRFRKGAPFLPWLRTITTRVGYRHWRRRRRDLNREAMLAERKRAHSREPSDTAEYVYRVLELLDPKDRLVLTLQYFEGCSTREIADRMGWTLSMVKVRAFRARRRLRTLLLQAEQN